MSKDERTILQDLFKVDVVIGVPFKQQFLQKGIIGSSEKLVKDVEVSFAFSLEHDAWLLQ